MSISDTTYCQFQYWMTKRLGLKGTELMIYGLIHGFSQDGTSFCYAPLSYMMEMTGLSKQGIINILKKLIEKGLIVKETVKQYVKQTKHGIRVIKASGAQFFCIYYTVESRKNTPVAVPVEENDEFCKPEEFDELDYSDFKDEKTAITFENPESTFLTREKETNDSRVNFLDPGESTFFTPPGQVSLPNNNDNNIYNKTSATSTSSTRESQREKIYSEAEAAYLFKINDLFGANVFSEDLMPFVLSLTTNTVELTEYLDWLYNYCKIKKTENLISLFYTLAKKQYMFIRFLRDKETECQKICKENEREKQKKEASLCPVCKQQISENETECQRCFFELAFKDSEKDIQDHQKLYQTLEKRALKQFLKEKQTLILAFAREKNFTQYPERYKALKDKFGITA